MWIFSVVCPILMQRFLLQEKKQQLCGGLDVNNDSVSSLESPGLVFTSLCVFYFAVERGGG